MYHQAVCVLLDAEAGLRTCRQEQVQKRERQATIAEYRRATSAADSCVLCFASARRQRHLTVAIGQSSYLALPARWALTARTSGYPRSDLLPLVCLFCLKSQADCPSGQSAGQGSGMVHGSGCSSRHATTLGCHVA